MDKKYRLLRRLKMAVKIKDIPGVLVENNELKEKIGLAHGVVKLNLYCVRP